MAPEQVRHHFISRQLVLTWMRQQRSMPSLELAGLATRRRRPHPACPQDLRQRWDIPAATSTQANRQLRHVGES